MRWAALVVAVAVVLAWQRFWSRLTHRDVSLGWVAEDDRRRNALVEWDRL